MWHASVKGGSLADAMKALHGVGDPSLGEWVEQYMAIHIRRRLSLQEQIRKGLTMRDLRGSPEGRQRAVRILALRPWAKELVRSEMESQP